VALSATLALGLSSLSGFAQQTRPRGSSSSSTQPSKVTQDSQTKPTPHVSQPEAGGSGITLETSEPLFDIAVALNACGYDADLVNSSPVRKTIREEVDQELAASADARTSRDAICTYIQDHQLTDSGRNLAQYVSLALYLTPPPALTAIVDETEMASDATQVVNILPALRTFVQNAHLNAIWFKHRAEYEALVNQVHDPLTHMILETNVYLHMPPSAYDGRRFMVLLEPMLSPAAANARIYGNDYIVVTSPAAEPPGAVHMEQIRHTYLHYVVEPLVYARAAAMDRLLPLLKPVQAAPLDFTYKADIVALLTECLIKAAEIQTMDVGIPKPKRPDAAEAAKERTVMEHYDAEMSAYDRQAEAIRQKSVDLAMRQGWVLVEYFYAQLGVMTRESVSLKDEIGPMVYGMEVDRVQHRETQIAFLPEGTHDVVRRVPHQPTGLQLAEIKMLKGDPTGAEEIAQKELADPKGDHPQAHYVVARVDMMEGQPDEALTEFAEVIRTSKDPRTLAWSHIYLGRLYDVMHVPERDKAIAEYKAALTVRDSRPDTKAAAEQGIKQPFVLPKRANPEADDDNAPLDPSGKAEKEAYRPSTPR
jgi:tetratricopeptide (TPR) repeat protein